MSQPISIQSANGVIATNDRQEAVIVIGMTVPSNGGKGFSPGCLFIQTGTPALYQNTGTANSSVWSANS